MDLRRSRRDFLSFARPAPVPKGPIGEVLWAVAHFRRGPDGRVFSWTPFDSLLTQVGTVPKKAAAMSAVSSGGAIRFDRDGAAWMATHGDGIMRIAFPGRFQGGRISEKDPLVEKYSGKDGLSDAAVFACWRIAKATSGSVRRAGLDRFRNRNLGWSELQPDGFG